MGSRIAAHAAAPLTRALIAGLALALSLPAAAQWPIYEAKQAPRKSDGTANLEAPAPRTRDGHPDLSGLWERFGGGGGGGRGANQNPNPQQPSDGSPPVATFGNLGAGLPGGLPYTPLAAMLRDERIADNQKNNPDAKCLPMGLTQLHLHPQPRKIVQTPNLDENLQPWWYGYSVGHWEGDVLVVETVGFRDDVWLDVQGSPLTGRAKMTEHFRRPSFGTLQIDVTIDDPTAYTKPFTVRVNQRLFADAELIEFICNENEKSVRFYDP